MTDGSRGRPGEQGRRPRRARPLAAVGLFALVAAVSPWLPDAGAQGPGERRVTLEFKDADVVHLLRLLAVESGRNIVFGDDVKGKMSITLRDVPWTLALDTILETQGLEKVERERVLRIVSTERLTKEREARARAEEAKLKAEAEIRQKQAEARLRELEAVQRGEMQEQLAAEQKARGPLREEMIRLNYGDPDEIAKTLAGILGLAPEGQQQGGAPGAPGAPAAPGGTGGVPGTPGAPSPPSDVLAKGITIKAHKPTNSIFIRHYTADLARIKALIRENFDVPLPQVKIEARMEILDREDLYAIGVQWGGGGVGTWPGRGTLVGRGLTTGQDTSTGTPVYFRTPKQLENPKSDIGTKTDTTKGTVIPVDPTSGLPKGGNLVNLPIGSLLGGAAGAGAGGFTFGIIGTRLSLHLALEALRTEGKTVSVARPDVVTVENAKASMALGEEIPYATTSESGTQIQFKEALLRLEVTPTVVREPDGTRIKMKVIVENNARTATTINLGSMGAPPVIAKRRAETEVLIREGEHLVIGGVTTTDQIEEQRKIPLLGDIPWLGWLFKQEGTQNKRKELVVFITPTVLRHDAPKAAVPGAVPPSGAPPRQR